MIYIVGHKNPDTDSIVSAVVMADYFKKIGKKSKALRVGKINKETKFVLNKAKIKLPSLVKNLSKKKVFLVDHNEAEQAGIGIERAEIFGILDHHRLGGMTTKEPIYVRIEPIGSTSTLVFNLFQEKKIQLKKNQAFLLLSGIISDTLKLTSPATTKEDRKAVEILAKISQTNINTFSQEIFKIRSDISGIKLKDLIFSDYKEYKEKDLTFGIGVHETMNPGIVLKKDKEILSTLETFKKDKKLNLIFFALVDILNKKTYFFLPGDKEKEIAEKAFKNRASNGSEGEEEDEVLFAKKAKENLLLLPGVVSRKKQIVPPILEVL